MHPNQVQCVDSSKFRHSNLQYQDVCIQERSDTHILSKITKVVYTLCCLDIPKLILHQQLLEDFQKIYQKC